VSADRVRSRISACHPCNMSSLKNITVTGIRVQASDRLPPTRDPDP